MIRPVAGGEVEGLILHDLAPEDVAALDKFEGATYSLKEMTAILPDGREHPVMVYVDCGIYEDGGPFVLESWAGDLRRGFIDRFMKGRGFDEPANGS